jgi:Zn-dependent peptidase ImmA (M78 family)
MEKDLLNKSHSKAMKRAFAILLLLVFICACITEDNNSPPSITVESPIENALYLEPYEEMTFIIGATDPDGKYNEIRWYVDDEFIEYGNELKYTFYLERSYEIKTVVDDGKFNTSHSWNVEVEIDITKMMDEMSSLRGLEFKEKVPFRSISRDELSEMLTEDFAQTKEELLVDEKVMRAFHVWDDDSLAEEVLLFYSTGVEGYYDMLEKEFVLVDEGSKHPAVKMVTLAHELIHVLQDQYYDTTSMLETSNDDEYIALTSLMEGDATYFESYYLYGMGDNAIADYFMYYNKLPEIQVKPIVSDLVMFPYLQGFKFISKIVADNGIEYLEKVYMDPPQTTEQVMHPQKYYSRELGQVVDPIYVEGMELIDENVLGESNIFIFLDQYLETYRAKAAADGWNGDLYSYYEKGDDNLLIFISIWDDAEEAETFVEIYLDFLQALPRSPFSITQEGSGTYWLGSEAGNVAIRIENNEVRVLSSNNGDIIEMILPNIYL